MASEKDKPTRRELTEAQDQSIKARKTQLFDENPLDESLATQSFAHYLKSTPPAPLASWVRIALWALGAVVLLLFLAAIFSVRHWTALGKTSDGSRDVTSSVIVLNRGTEDTFFSEGL